MTVFSWRIKKTTHKFLVAEKRGHKAIHGESTSFFGNRIKQDEPFKNEASTRVQGWGGICTGIWDGGEGAEVTLISCVFVSACYDLWEGEGGSWADVILTLKIFFTRRQPAVHSLDAWQEIPSEAIRSCKRTQPSAYLHIPLWKRTDVLLHGLARPISKESRWATHRQINSPPHPK